MPDRFGGVPVEGQADRFGGVPVSGDGPVIHQPNEATLAGAPVPRDLQASPQPGAIERLFPNMTAGARQFGSAIPAAANGRIAPAISDAIEGAGKFAMPFATGAALASPVAAIGAGAGAALGVGAGKLGARMFDASPETERAVMDVSSIPGAMLGGRIADPIGDVPRENWLNAGEGLPWPVGPIVKAGRTLFSKPPSMVERPTGVTGGRPITTESSIAPAPVSGSSEPGPGYSGTQLTPPTGRAGGTQSPVPVPMSPRSAAPPAYGGGDPSQYVFSGGNQFRIPAPTPPAPRTIISPQAEYAPRSEFIGNVPRNQFFDPRETGAIVAPPPVEPSDTPKAVRDRATASRAKFDENGKRNQLKPK